MSSIWNFVDEVDEDQIMDNYIQVLENDYISELDSELVSAVGTQDTETTDSILENDYISELDVSAAGIQDTETKDSNSWSSSATKLLITLRGACHEKFEKIKKKGKKLEQWDVISKEMKAKNINVSPKQCDEKWRRLLTRFRQVRDASKKSRSGGIKWQYYILIENAISSTARQTISPPKNLLHESTKVTNSSIEMPELESSISLSTTSESSFTGTPKPLFSQNSHEKIPAWFTKFEKLRNDQLEATNNNANQLNMRLDKLEKRDEMMLNTQEKLLKKLDDANQIEIQKMELFKKIYDINT